MKLTDLTKDIENIDQEAIIFQEDRGNPNSDIIISFAEEGDEGIKEVEGRKYYYLIEVFLAKEFLEDWEANLDYKPTLEQKAKRLYDY
ncbi:hypothetical protein D3C87_1624480 [compost metagenome]